MCDGPRVHLVWPRKKETQCRCSAKKGTGGTLTVVVMKSILKRFLRTLVGGQGLRDDDAPSLHTSTYPT